MNKNIKFDDDLANQIQQFANSKTDGNFTQAVDLLIRSALLSNCGHRFVLFGGITYYAKGGYRDYQKSSDNIEELEKFGNEEVNKIHPDHWDWWHIVDIETNKIVSDNGVDAYCC